jgi:glycosyltransferase involved in cell wall biosynthesis
VRIVHISIGALPPPFTTGGGAVARRVAELAREQVRRGHDVMVIAPGQVSGEDRIDGVRVGYVRCRMSQPWAYIEFQARALALATQRRHRPDVLHVHDEPELGLAVKPTGIPTVFSYDNFYFRGGGGSRLAPVVRRPLRAYVRHSLRAFGRLLPPTHYCRDESVAYWGLPEERVDVLPNGVNLEQFSAQHEAAARERDGIDGPVVLYLGRICRQKGSDTLLAAAERLHQQGVRANVLLAGPVGGFDSADRQQETADWERRITAAGARWLGRVPDSRLAGLLTMADVFVMPTRELEMQGMAALEAQACGTPVVASDQGGLPETVPDDCGVRFEPGDADALAQAVACLLADDDARAAYSAAALEHARSLSWERIVDRLMPLYERARDE